MKNNHYIKSNEAVSQRFKSLLTSSSSVYEQYFGLKEKPFKCCPNPEYVYLSPAHKEALSLLIYAISSGEGFTSLTGNSGTGKTTLIHVLLTNLAEQYSAVHIFNPQVDSLGLLKAINVEFGLPSESNHEYSLMDELNRFLLRQKAEGKKSFLIIDEAQGLKGAVWEQLRLLSNLETNASKLLHIILVGTPDLVRQINSRSMRHLNQRMDVQNRLKPMGAADTRAYIHYRLKAATTEDGVKFTRMACLLIHLKTHGIARLINRLCEVCLMVAYSKQRRKITAAIVAIAVREISGQRRCGVKSKKIRGFLFGCGAACAVLICAAVFGATVAVFMPNAAPPLQATPRAYFSIGMRPAQTPEAGKLHAQTHETADAGPAQGNPDTTEAVAEPADTQIKMADAGPAHGNPDTAEAIAEPADTQIKMAVPDLPHAQLLPAVPQAETADRSPAGDLSLSAGSNTGNKPSVLPDSIIPSPGQPHRDESAAARKTGRAADIVSGPDDLPKAHTRPKAPPKKTNQPISKPKLRAMPSGKKRPFVRADFEALLAQADIESNRRNVLAAVMRLWNPTLAKETHFNGVKNDLRFFQQAAAANDLSIQAMICDLEALNRIDRPCILELFVPALQASRYVAVKSFRDQGAAVISAGEKTDDILVTVDQLSPYWTGAVYIPQKKGKGSIK